MVWYSDTSAEAAQKRKEEMVPKSLEDKQIESEVEEVAKALKDSSLLQDNVSDKLKQLKATHGFSDQTLLTRALAALFGPSVQDLQAEIKNNQAALRGLINSPEAQLALLAHLETLCGTTNAALAAKIALALKELYDLDLVEEETFLKWSNAPEINALIKEKASPFLKWLHEAEEESSEEEEND